jgi:autotransporter-associated beta strand protein
MSGNFTNTGNLNFTNSGTGAFTVSGNVLSGGDVTFNANNTQAFTVSANYLNPAGRIINSGTGTGTTTISGKVGASPTALVQNSASSPIVVSGNMSDFSGDFVLNAGRITVSSGGSMLKPFGINQAANTIFQLDAGTNYNIDSISSAAGSQLIFGSGLYPTNLNFTDTADTTIAGSVTMAGSGTINVVKNGVSDWTLQSGLAYNGSTTINQGSIIISGSNPVEVFADRGSVTLANAAGV